MSLATLYSFLKAVSYFPVKPFFAATDQGNGQAENDEFS
jgi:hypothetical protein